MMGAVMRYMGRWSDISWWCELSCKRCGCCFFFLRIRRPPRSTQSRSSAASDVYKRQAQACGNGIVGACPVEKNCSKKAVFTGFSTGSRTPLSLIHISEPTRPY